MACGNRSRSPQAHESPTYLRSSGVPWRVPWLFRSVVCGGGDQGDLGESSAHPKPPAETKILGLAGENAMADNHSATASGGGGVFGDVDSSYQRRLKNKAVVQDGRDPAAADWAMEVYAGKNTQTQEGVEEDILEFDLDGVLAEEEAKFQAIARYYSKKHFNAPGMFREMMEVWGIEGELHAEQFQAKRFTLEFNSEAERRQVVEGGPWWHKGDALIVVPYDGIDRPSAVSIDTIGLWLRFYDLPPVMKNEESARKLGEQFGKFIKMDKRASAYLRVRVAFPLDKVLVPEMKIRLKGRAPVSIAVKYENVPHFCFACGRIGHAEANCQDSTAKRAGIRYGEELRASPPNKRAREIVIKPVAPKAARPLHFANM